MNEPIAFSNSIRLNAWQWLGVALFALVLVIVAPPLWKLYEDCPLEPDHRMPHELSNDYWLFERYAGLAAEKYDAVILGDSVVWGEYVTPDETLSHYLNKEAGRERFANLGLEGAHQLALSGLVRHYAGSVINKNVVLQCNPLWLSSPRADLSDDSAEPVHHHPDLIPQFTPRVPRYKEEISARLGVLVQQRFAFNKWTKHLQHAYYDHADLPGWTLKHPYENPLEPLASRLPPLDHAQRKEQLPWFKNSKALVAFDWVEPDESLQWHAFKDVVEVLQQRGNRVFVLVGPFNEHMLTPASLERYQKVKGTIKAWLEEKQIEFAMPAALRSEQYGDASHPLAVGYATLARQLQGEPFFQGNEPRP